MNARQSPVPEIRITATPITNKETGHTSVTVVIDAVVEVGPAGEVSSGIIVLDELTDILILKKAIDKFITDYKIEQP